jgi:hypothetical protein
MYFAGILALTLAANPAEHVGKFKDRAIVEPSGIVASRQYPGIFWVHNDSGNPPALFAVRLDGTLVRKYLVDAPNIDWEDIAVDGSGHLYLGDIGDNLHVLPVHAILRIDEPNPALPIDEKAKLHATSFCFRYPERIRHDAESLYIDDTKAMIVTKRGDLEEAELFAVSLDSPGSLLKPADAKRVGNLKGFKKPATGADLSVDGRWLAVCGLGEVKLYRRDADGRWWNTVKLKSPPGQVEAVTWLGADLILANEDREIYRITEKSWKAEIREKGKLP